MALEITDASYGIFRLVDRSGKYLVTRSFTGQGLAEPLGGEPADRRHLGDGVCGQQA